MIRQLSPFCIKLKKVLPKEIYATMIDIAIFNLILYVKDKIY